MDHSPLSTPTLTAVTVTYNRLARLQDSLPRLLAEGPDRVVVVNNASTDGTGAWLAALTDPRVTIITLPDNRGGAGGFEAGLAAARALGADWYLLLDDDAWPEPGALAAFRALTPGLPAGTGAVAAAVFLPDGAISEMNRPGWNPFWHPRMIGRTLRGGTRVGFKLADAAFGPQAPALAIDNASFVGFFLADAGLRRTGLPDGGMFIYGDDVVYALRLRRAGFGIQFLPTIRFCHDCGSLDAHFVYRPLWKVYYHCRNGVKIARAAAGPWVFPLALLWYGVVWVRRGLRAGPAERPVYWRMMRQGIRDGILGRTGRNDSLHRAAGP